MRTLYGKFALKAFLAPRVGFEPTTDRLTADCSATELPRKVTHKNNFMRVIYRHNQTLQSILKMTFLSFS